MLQSSLPASEMLALLRGVSRSFYLSIRLLPPQLLRPVAVAYLLARASDTLADTGKLPAGDRIDKLRSLAAAVDGGFNRSGIAHVAESFAPVQDDPGERNLIMALPGCLAWLEELAQSDRDDVRAVLRHITRGQLMDLERFGQGTPPATLDSAKQLEEYAYFVAGSVGEFWTDLCFRHLPGFAALPNEQMRELGREYGMGLQLVNILRDAGADLAAGRCYFPADELAAAGLPAEGVLGDPIRFEGVWMRWQASAQHRLENGIRYARAIRSRRVRAASAMPALIGARTLALLRAAGPQRVHRKVKVPRGEIRSIMARLALTLAAREPMQALFGRLRADPGSG